MKTKFTILALLLTVFAISSASAAIRYVDPTGSDAANDCLTIGSPCATIAYALSVADQGDTIQLFPGTYTEGEIDIDENGSLEALDFVTIQGPNLAAATIAGTTPVLEVDPAGRTAGDADEAVFDCTSVDCDYIFSIGADNVTISSIDIVGDPDETWAAVKIATGGWDRWTIEYNFIHEIGQKNPGSIFNHSYGIYGDSQTSDGSVTMTGNEIQLNHIYELGGEALTGSNETAGMGLFLEGIEGLSAECNASDKFDCGVWIHDNTIYDLNSGQNELNFTVDVNGKEPSTAMTINQDPQNTLPNNGARVNDNEYGNDTFFDSPTNLDFGVVIGIGDSSVEEDNENFDYPTLTTNPALLVSAYVVNIDRKATIDELALADFYKSLEPNLLGPGSDAYFSTLVLATDNSADEATIVFLDETDTSPDLFTVNVIAQGEGVSYKVSLDGDGDLNVRQGARLLFDGVLSDGLGTTTGVTDVVLGGTAGDDLLTVDFNNGNPIPLGDGTAIENGIDFDGEGGFDSITLRGDEQADYETIDMHDADGGRIFFEPDFGSDELAPTVFTDGSTSSILFDNLEPIDDVIIVNTQFSVIAADDTDNEINIIGGPFRFGFDTFQINSGAVKTFEEVNYANKKHVHVFGSDDTGSGDGDDVFTVFTPDGDAPDLMLSLSLYGGNVVTGGGPSTDPDDDSDDYFVIRPSADFPISVNGGDHDSGDYIFLDCANTSAACDPGTFTHAPGTHSITGFEDITKINLEDSADDLSSHELSIRKELVGFAATGAHPGDDLEYRVTVRNDGAGSVDLSAGDSLWVTDVVDHRLSLIEQSIVTEAGTVDITDNRSMLWLIEDVVIAIGDSVSMTYTVIVNTLITTEDVDNWASILNHDGTTDQFVDGDPDDLEHYAKVELELLDVFGFPLKAAINSALFFETEAGPRYMVGLHGGAKDPALFGVGAVLCRVPDTNEEAGWDGGLGNLWYSCGEGLPNNDGIPEPLIVTDLYLDSSDRIWLTSWGHSGLFYSDDGGQTWTDAEVDLSGGQGGSPDGIADGFAQIYAITEDILGTLYISANNGDVYRSFDRGSTWQKAKQLPQGSADTAFSLQADPTLPGTLYAGTFGDSLYVTTDFGETWARPDGIGLGSGYIFDIEFDPLSGNLFVGTALGIYYSADGGDNWTGLNTAFPIPAVPPEVRNITFDEDGALFASTWGQGVWSSLDWQALSLTEFALKTGNVMDISIDGGSVYILTDTGEYFSFKYESALGSVDIDELDGSEIPREFTLDQNYPNPFNPVTTIQFTLPQTADINLTVFDVLGRQVAVLINGQQAAGRHTVNFQASDLPSGIYLYRLTTPGGSIAQKMILLK